MENPSPLLKKLAGQSYSGRPFYDVRIYMVGIRRDLDKKKFCFPEASVFIEKMKNRNGRCKLGFFIAWNGVTDDFSKELLRMNIQTHYCDKYGGNNTTPG